MGKQPCPIVPVPKRLELGPGHKPWPRDVRVENQSEHGEPLVARYERELPGRHDGALAVRLMSGDCKPQGYTLRFQDGALDVTAADSAGFRHALSTLKQVAATGTVPEGRIDDWPALSIRGFHLNFESYRRLDVDRATDLMRVAARFKLNTVLLEYGPRFPFESHREIRDHELSIESVERLEQEAVVNGLRVIPLQQSLAHLDYALRQDSLSHLREKPDRHNLMCPLEPESFSFFKSLASEIIARHPGSEWFQIGGDEARKIGHCPRCVAAVRRDGPGAVFGKYIGQIARWVLDQGLRPVVWDDTLCAYPAAIEHLPTETIIQYWDYIAVADPTPVLIPRMAHALGGPRVAHDWSWLVPGQKNRLSDVQRRVMQSYSRAANLKRGLHRDYMKEFGRYLGEGFPKWIRALPYLEYYRDRGYEVITSPTGMGNGDTEDGVPNFERFEHNIRTHAKRCRANGTTLGMITTAWYDMPPELLYQPIIRTAQCAW